MQEIGEINEKIKALKDAREILHGEYTNTDFHKRKEANPGEYVPPTPDDEETIKLLTAIQQLDIYIKKLQDEQFSILKEKGGE